MQQSITFKNINEKIHVIADQNLSFESFLKLLKNRLDKLYIKDDLLKTNVTIDVRKISLDSKKILSLFDLLSEYETLYVDKIIYNESDDKNIILYEGNIRSGEIKLFSKNTLLIGNVNKGAKVIINGNLYVIGKVNGIIEFKNINNKLMAASVEDSNIKVCSYEKRIAGTKENIVINVKENQIVEENFVDRRGNIYGKSNCSYIW